MKFALLPMVVLLVLPSAFAFSCSQLNASQQDLCNQIISSNYTADEQNALITMLIYTNKNVPNYDLVSLWNQPLNAISPPDNVTAINQGTIKNAWMRIFGVMPSVIDNSALYCSNQGTLQSAYNYTYQLPTGTQSGDCRTDYSFYADRTNFAVLLNNQRIGSSKLSSYSGLTNSTALFSSVLDILLDTKVDHYKNHRYCYYSGGWCNGYYYRCEYDSTEIKTDELILKDNLTAQTYSPIHYASIVGLDSYRDNIKGELSYQNVSYLHLSIGSASYEKSSYIYDFVYSFPPYNFITLSASPLYQEKINGIIKENSNPYSFDFIAPQSDNCTLIYANHFQSSTNSCFLDNTALNISIKTDKFYYNDNETINLTISPSNILLNISYANQTITAQGLTSLQAVYPNNKISAFYKDNEIDVFVAVINQSHWAVAWDLSLFFLINYLLYRIITRKRRSKND